MWNEDVAMTNLGACLESHPPDHEVLIREGSSWSCAHGLGRWKEDCGCNTGGQPGWRQGWRVHLRAALEGLREDLHRIFVEQGDRYLTDVWAARDGYIDLILDHSARNVEGYLMKHARRSLSTEERAAALQLLEMQRHALLMQTSCGWFFDDISGIEARYVLKFAKRAIQLAAPYAARDLEQTFIKKLAQAKSNLPGKGTGADIYNGLEADHGL